MLGVATIPFLASIVFCSNYERSPESRTAISNRLATPLRQAHELMAYLMTEHTLNALNSSALVFGENLLDGIRDFPVLGSGLDGTQGGFSGLVSSG